MAEPIFGELAAALLAPGSPLTPEAAELLGWLGLSRPTLAGPAAQHQARLFQAAAGFERLFQLEAPDAPGLVVWGAEASPDGFSATPGHGLFGVSGAGTAPLEALNACIGEAIELLSQAETAADRAQQRPAPPAGQPALPPPWDQAADGWLPTRRLTDGATLWVPAELCLRRPGGTPPWPLSIGCGAGASVEAAALHGLLELLERDAAALWWRGGVRPRPLPLEDPASAAAAALLASLRRSSRGRRTWLLDITSDLGVPAVAAVSVAASGRGFCCGTAARLSLEAAARAALRELAQMELALAVVAAKRAERGEAALNPRDRGHEARAEGIDAASCALLHPLAAPAPPSAAPLAAEPAAALAWLVARLAEAGLAPLLLPLTRPEFGVPVCRVLCPGLATIPSEAMVPRLAEAIARTGGGDCHSERIPLM
jgi:ribosomal protein S12 methylthiotransferase accessory factor